MISQYTLNLGLFDKDTKQQEVSTIDAFKVAAKIASELCGGATITEGTGVYTHADGTQVVEPSLVITILDCFADNKEDFRKAVLELRDKLQFYFNQESVLLTVYNIESL